MLLHKILNFRHFCWFLVSLALFFVGSAQAGTILDGVRIWAAPESTRVVFDLNKANKFSYFHLSSPNRLVIDFPHTVKSVNLNNIENNSKLIKKIRLSRPPKKGTLRLVLDLTRSVQSNLFALAPTSPYGHRLVVDLQAPSHKAPVIKPVAPVKQKNFRDVVVAIDAGHGGDDPGSIGPSGMYEKKITMQIANRVAEKINQTPGMKAVLTRKGDYFVNLNRRSEIARKSKADLLISIHADAFTSPQPRGASVWVLSRRRANSEIGRWLEKKEKHSELLGGAGEIMKDANNEQYLAMTFLDMSMDRSMAVSHGVAADILSDLSKVTRLHKQSPESASFAVLKSPDIPSILVETGFISNPYEERLLKNSAHQTKLAKAIHQGVVRYFKDNPPENSILAMKGNIKHNVRRGESLSVIAQKYSVSVANIKLANALKSDRLRIGQQLTIPR